MAHGISFTCAACPRKFSTARGRDRHHRHQHRQFTPASEGEDENDFQRRFHPLANALPCRADGTYLPPFAPPPPPPPPPEDGLDPDNWNPFGSRVDFDFAHYHFVELQTSADQINTALELWAATVLPHGKQAPWGSAAELYASIDAIQHGALPWKTYSIHYTGPLPPGTPPKWMAQEYELCMRDVRQILHHQLATAAFREHVDLVPYRQFNHDGKRVWSNLMSGDWVWKQADEITKDPANHGCMVAPVVAGSDKTTVSVATGHQEYHSAYVSLGNLSGTTRRGHNDVVKCPDGHFRRVVYSLGPYIADYPEQVWLAGIVQNWCPKCEAHPDHLDDAKARLRTQIKTDLLIKCFDPGILWDDYGVRADVVAYIHELLSSDLLHQVIKGTFKDHIVTWVNEYLHLTHPEKRALEIIQDIDRRISAVPEFPGLCRFPYGRDFHQWTGDDSKDLMKIYLAAITGYVPSDMVKCVAAFMDFCYLVRRNTISSDDLQKIQDMLDRFHLYRVIFIESGVRVDISLPRQHSLVHYIRFIRLFGAPNGLCSSITESKHIQAVKEPWRRSSHYMALAQMLVTLSRLSKLAAALRNYTLRGMMAGTTSSYTAAVLDAAEAAAAAAAVQDEEEDDGVVHGPRALSDIELAVTSVYIAHTSLERGYPKQLNALANYIGRPEFPLLFRQFLHEEVHGPLDPAAPPIPLANLPHFAGQIGVHHSATARFYAPSDLGGAGGMYRENIRSNPNWHGYARRDTVLVDVGGVVMGGIVIGRVQLFFSFSFREKDYSCALVNWVVPVGDAPDPDTGMWVVEPERQRGVLTSAIIPLDSIARAVLPEEFHFSNSLDAFDTFFVNPYADHHMHEFLCL
ncbi:hypothetical protein C8J57DRAFT_1674990 [Mycena rebaudengoi]|nr:hypothetical protein C8J57DRAFT_1674990 [Mycena rebaudengoi]